MKNFETNKDGFVILECPHCGGTIVVKKKQFNCRIFRHGVYKINNTQIHPHMSEEKCKKLKEKDLIYGCGKPFRINGDNIAVPCGYI
jgi:DNA-directed RNA polymerase subunit RPC12/RpoP